MTSRMLRAAAGAPLLAAACFVAGWAMPLLPGAATCAAAGYTSRVALVVEHADGRSLRLCIGFDGASITGEQILQASGLGYATATYPGLGDAVCQIDSEPASYPPSCLTATNPYWAMFFSRGGGAWSVAGHGVSSQTFGDGDAEGFRYDPQSGAAAVPVPAGGICTMPAHSGSTASPAALPTAHAKGPAGDGDTSPGPSTAVVPTMAGVIAVVTPSPRSGPTSSLAASRPPSTAGVNPGLLIASAALGGLSGLAFVRRLRRRRT